MKRYRVRKRESGKEGGRERETETERERERDRELLFLFLKGMTSALAPFSYLLSYNYRYIFEGTARK